MKNDLFSLTSLKYFCDAIRLGSLSAAAKENFVTQSAISQGIANLEKSLQTSLVTHHPNRLQLTPRGKSIYQKSAALLRDAVEFKRTLSQDPSVVVGSLQFACTHSFSLAVIPAYLKRFREEHPSAKVQLHLGQSENIIAMLQEGAVDFGILPLEVCQNAQCELYEDTLAKFEKRVIYSGKFSLYSPARMKKSEQKKLGFILTPPTYKENALFLESYYKKFQQKPSAILEVGSWEVIANLVSEGMGIGYLPDYIAMRRERLLEPCDFGLETQEYRISAIFPKGAILQKSSEVFLSYFR
jgi:DNA-binding transcriptional LysR family regulator